MKYNSKLSFVLLLVVSMFLGAPLSVSAVEGTSQAKPSLCTRLASVKSTTLTKLEERATTVGVKRTDRQSKLKTNRETRNQSLEAKRAELDSKRQEHYDKLLEKASTDSQKAAVATFQAAVEKAVTDRRVAYDAAMTKFKSGVDAAISSQQTLVDAAKAKLKQDVSAAFDKAIITCEAGGVDAKNVSETLQADLKAAKEAYKNSVKSALSLKEEIAALKATKEAAFKLATQNFKTALEAAKAALRIALGEVEL